MAKNYKSYRQDVRSRAHEKLDNALDKADSIREKTRNNLENVKEKMRNAREDVDDYIAENPERSMLIAAGVGAGLGMLASAMLRRR